MWLHRSRSVPRWLLVGRAGSVLGLCLPDGTPIPIPGRTPIPIPGNSGGAGVSVQAIAPAPCTRCGSARSRYATGPWCSRCEKAEALTEFYGDSAFVVLRLAQAVANQYRAWTDGTSRAHYLGELTDVLDDLCQALGMEPPVFEVVPDEPSDRPPPLAPVLSLQGSSDFATSCGVCGVSVLWRDHPDVPDGQFNSCGLEPGHPGPHVDHGFRWNDSLTVRMLVTAGAES